LRKPRSGFAAFVGLGSVISEDGVGPTLKDEGTAEAIVGVEGRDIGWTLASGGGLPGVIGLEGPVASVVILGGVVSILAKGGALFRVGLVVDVAERKEVGSDEEEEEEEAAVGKPLKSGIGVTPNTGFAACGCKRADEGVDSGALAFSGEVEGGVPVHENRSVALPLPLSVKSMVAGFGVGAKILFEVGVGGGGGEEEEGANGELATFEAKGLFWTRGGTANPLEVGVVAGEEDEDASGCEGSTGGRNRLAGLAKPF
jgi:hypothetical protein